MTAHIDRITVMPSTDWQPPRAFVTVADDQRPGFSLTDMVTLPDCSLNSYNMAQAHGYRLCRQVNALLDGLPSGYPVDPDTGAIIDWAGAHT